MQTDNPSQAYRSPWMTGELEILHTVVRKFVQSEPAPYEPTWQKQGYIDREDWLLVGEMGIVLTGIPEAYGTMATIRAKFTYFSGSRQRTDGQRGETRSPVPAFQQPIHFNHLSKSG